MKLADGSYDDPATVLVVDDNQMLVDQYGDVLASEYELQTAYSGAEAIRALDERVDVMLLDPYMPGCSEDDVLARLRETHSSCMVAFISEVEIDFDVLELPFDMYLEKPVGAEQLRGAVETLLERGSYGRAIRELCAKAEKRVALQQSSAVIGASESFETLATDIERNWAELDAEAFDSEELRRIIP